MVDDGKEEDESAFIGFPLTRFLLINQNTRLD